MQINVVKISDIDEEELNDICLVFDIEKKCKIKKFLNKKDKIRTVIAEILLRTIIIEKLNIGNKVIVFEKNKYGKPFIKGYPDFNFNISHSGDFVACATDNEPIGIDIEKVKQIDYKEIAKSFFSEIEFDYIVKENPNVQLDKFYEIWTLKESYIKCCGQGLSMPLNSFSIDIDKYKNINVIVNNKRKEHLIKSFDIEGGYKMAVCSINKNFSENIINVNQNILISKFNDFNLESGEV